MKKKKLYMSPALKAVEMEEEAMLCTSGGFKNGENLDNQTENNEDGDDMDPSSLSGSSSSVWNEW